jgi:hypothetical protein
MTSKFMTSPRLRESGAACLWTRQRSGQRRFVENGRYVSGYRNAGQPIPSIGLGVYGVAAACSRAGAVALAAGFAADLAAAGFFTTDFAAVGFFAAFFGALFFFAGFAMPRNLLHRPSIVKRSISAGFDQ